MESHHTFNPNKMFAELAQVVCPKPSFVPLEPTPFTVNGARNFLSQRLPEPHPNLFMTTGEKILQESIRQVYGACQLIVCLDDQLKLMEEQRTILLGELTKVNMLNKELRNHIEQGQQHHQHSTHFSVPSPFSKSPILTYPPFGNPPVNGFEANIPEINAAFPATVATTTLTTETSIELEPDIDQLPIEKRKSKIRERPIDLGKIPSDIQEESIRKRTKLREVNDGEEEYDDSFTDQMFIETSM